MLPKRLAHTHRVLTFSADRAVADAAPELPPGRDERGRLARPLGHGRSPDIEKRPGSPGATSAGGFGGAIVGPPIYQISK